MVEYKTSPTTVLATVIITALLVGSGSFFWQKQSYKETGGNDTNMESTGKALPTNWEKLTVNPDGDAFGYTYSFDYPADWVQSGNSVKTGDRDLAGKAGAEFYFNAEAPNTKGNTHLFRYEFVGDTNVDRDYFTAIFRHMIDSFQFEN